MLDDSLERWERFRERIGEIKEEVKNENGDVKVFFFGRHGQGWREYLYFLLLVLLFRFKKKYLVDNVAEVKYGTKCWDAYVVFNNYSHYYHVIDEDFFVLAVRLAKDMGMTKSLGDVSSFSAIIFSLCQAESVFCRCAFI